MSNSFCFYAYNFILTFLSLYRFVRLFRLNKCGFKYLLEEVERSFKPVVRSSSVPNIIKLAATLRFFAQGSYQQGVGQDFLVGMCQAGISKTIAEMLTFIEQKICGKWISFAMSPEEKIEAKITFFNETGFPGVLGCVDGTHISIVAPTQSEHLFYNRKGFHSLNAMIVSRYLNGKFE